LILGRLITLVYGAAFQGATRFAMILLPGQLFQGCTLVADGYLRGHGKAGAGIRARAVGAIAMAGCAVFLYKPYGALAVPLAATAGNTVSALWIGAAILRQTGWRPFWAATAPDQTS
jgi:Na+-driven multidrug efflux pump